MVQNAEEFLCILDQLGLNFEAINPKFSQIVGNIVVYNLCFDWSTLCFGSIKTPKLEVSVKKRNNRNKCFVVASAKTSFGSSFGCFKAKLVLQDTLSCTYLQ